MKWFWLVPLRIGVGSSFWVVLLEVPLLGGSWDHSMKLFWLMEFGQGRKCIMTIWDLGFWILIREWGMGHIGYFWAEIMSNHRSAAWTKA